MDKQNKGLIALISAIIIILLLVVFFVSKCSTGSSDSSVESTTTVATLSVISTDGSQDAVLEDTSFTVRDVEFGDSIKSVKKYEKNQNDTVNDSSSPSRSDSSDNYTYLTYEFNTEDAAIFYGVSVLPEDSTSMLTYVFYNEALIEIRVQFGELSDDVYDSLIANITDQVGDYTFSRTYSNGAVDTWWNTDDARLEVINESGVTLYYRQNS